MGINETPQGCQPSMKMIKQNLPDLSNVGRSAARSAGGDDPRTAALETLDVLEAMADGLVYFDKHDRLVICNRRYRDFYPGVAEGATFAEQLKATLNAGQINLEARTPEEYFAWRLQLHASPITPIETALADGRWLRITARKTARGGTVAIHTEITQLT